VGVDFNCRICYKSIVNSVSIFLMIISSYYVGVRSLMVIVYSFIDLSCWQRMCIHGMVVAIGGTIFSLKLVICAILILFMLVIGAFLWRD